VPDTAEIAIADPLLARLTSIVGAEGVLTGAAALPYITDIYRRRATPLAVVRPPDVATLSAAVAAATAAGAAIFPRGGGASYSDGYLPTRAQAVVVDLGRLDRIVEINAADAYVTVEAGVTWAALKAALDPLGLRTPFFGPFSGLAATVGGSVSQNSLSHGSGAHGISAQSVLGLEVVIASGEVIRTGAAALGAAPFARFCGPDLAGLFTGDCGALGIKARITLPLLRRKPAFGCASFAFATLADLAGAMRAAAMEGLDDEHFAIDEALSQGQIARQDAGAVFAMARSVLAAAPSLLAGAAQLARMAAAGARDLRAAQFMLHMIVEGVSRAEVNARLGRVRQLMAAGREIANSVPTVVRAAPFAPLYNTLGPRGERWVPLHGVLAHSQVAPFHAALQQLYAGRAETMRRLGVWTGGMFETVNSSGFLYEIAIYWPGARNDYHRAVVPADHLAGLPTYPDDAETMAFVDDLKTDITALLGRSGAVHFQLGKTYPYATALAPETLALVRAVKAELDPKGLMNPGALGL
jgi:FAD/FMN-containing dehydrogenase